MLKKFQTEIRTSLMILLPLAVFGLLLATEHLPSRLTLYGFDAPFIARFGTPVGLLLFLYLIFAVVNWFYVGVIIDLRRRDVRFSGAWGFVLQYLISGLLAILLLIAIVVNFQ